MAHFVRNVALPAALSGPGLARTIEVTESARPTKSISRNIEANITCRSVLSCVMALPLLVIFHFNCGLFSTRRSGPLTEAELCNRQIPYSLPCCSENGVAERRNKRRHPRLTDTRRRSVTVDDVYVRQGRHLINSSYGIVLKIRLVDYTFRSRNLARSDNAGPEDRGTLELGARRLRIYDQACVQGHIHSGNSHLTLIVDFDFHYRGDIGQEALMRRNPYPRSLAMLPLSPAGFFRDRLRNMAKTSGFPRIGVHRSPIVRVFHTLKVDCARLPD